MGKENFDESYLNVETNIEEPLYSDENLQENENLDEYTSDTEICTEKTESLDVEKKDEEDLENVLVDSEEKKEDLVPEDNQDDNTTFNDNQNKESVPVDEENTDLVDEYLEKADGEEEIDTTSSFELHEFEYSLRKFDIEDKEYEQCQDMLEEYGYIFLSDEDDRKSKYFADYLLQSIDTYGRIQKSELTFCKNQNDDCKNDFTDLKNYFVNTIEEELLVLDLCKFGHVQREYFLNSFYDFFKKDGNKIKFRELLAKRQIKLVLIVFDKDIDKKEDFLNIYKIKEDFTNKEEDILEENTSTDLIVSELISDETDNTIERALLFIISLFKGCTPIELQNMLYLILDDEDVVRWKKERKKLLGNLHIISKSEAGLAASMEFSSSLRAHEVQILTTLREEDPFFVLEFFDLFEDKEALLIEVLTGKKSQAFTNGFFQLIKAVSQDDPDKLSLNWFIDKFENNQDFSIDYFFALASCALQVSKALNDYTFLDNLVSHFYKKKELLPLLYLIEYFTYVDMFDKYKWYKEILSLLDEDPARGKLFGLLYKAIYKEVNADPKTIKIVLSWRSNNKVVNGYIFKILTRIASDSVRDNKDWGTEGNRILPFLFSIDEDEVLNEKDYLEYLFDFQDILKNCDLDITSASIAENINKLFFTKIIGLLRFYVNKSEQKSIIKTIATDIQKLIANPYILYETLLLLEWSFLLNNSLDTNSETKLKRNIFSVYLDRITKDELRISRNTTQILSNIFLKLSSHTRKNRELSGKYMMLRKELRNIAKDMKKK